MNAKQMPRQDAVELANAIAEFESRLPGWWWTTGSCNLTRDASCGPDRNGPDADLLRIKEFDEGFHHDGEGTVAESLRIVLEYALDRRAQARIATPAGPRS